MKFAHATTASAVALIAGAMLALPATAQETPQESSAASLDDVIVTAQRREQSLQEVPIAITAFGAETLERTAATGISDIAAKAPGVTLTQFNIGEPQLYIRGVGTSSDSAASDPSIGFSIDEVSIGRSGASALSFLDIERVEVLRGPQGTLYGRNASGGALNIYTRKPVFEDSGSITARIGSFDEYGLEGVVNRQLGDDSAIRFAARYTTNDGYAESLPSGEGLEGGTSWGARLSYLKDIGDWSVLVSGDYSEDDMDGHARIPVTASGTAPAFVTLIDSLRAGMDRRQSFSSPDNYQARTNYGLTGRVEHSGQAFDFVSLTSYRDNDYSWRDNLGGLPFPGFPLSVDNRASEAATQFSQEFRLVSKPDSAINWVAGAYFFQEDIDRSERFIVNTALPIAPPSFGGDTTFLQDATNRSYAVFGQANIPFAEIWELTLGARWTWDEREIHQVAIDNEGGANPPVGIPLGPGGSPYNVSGSESFNEPTWKIALAVEPVDNVRFYASYDRGYKAGSFPSTAQSGAQALLPLDSELLDNYEIGVKSTLMGRWRLNAAAFKLDYTDLQVYELLGLALVTSNAQAEVEGFEIETALALTNNLTIGGSYTSLDAKFTSDAVSGLSVLPYNGNTLPRSPDSQYTLYVDSEWDVAGGVLAARADYQWTDDFYFDPSNNPEVLSPAHELVSAFVSWESPTGFKVSVYGKNLTDTEYQTHIIKNVSVGFSVFGAPRSFGLALTQTF
ncbi:TonB-dependent receptor [Brevundimonas sp. GCM10030266]|uniref:TonB-dependent receptor n=1 Tax=Brevundimonas sp. GCM10030266 TaxID=3273386 RepID=UPI00361A3CFB